MWTADELRVIYNKNNGNIRLESGCFISGDIFKLLKEAAESSDASIVRVAIDTSEAQPKLKYIEACSPEETLAEPNSPESEEEDEESDSSPEGPRLGQREGDEELHFYVDLTKATVICETDWTISAEHALRIYGEAKHMTDPVGYDIEPITDTSFTVTVFVNNAREEFGILRCFPCPRKDLARHRKANRKRQLDALMDENDDPSKGRQGDKIYSSFRVWPKKGDVKFDQHRAMHEFHSYRVILAASERRNASLRVITCESLVERKFTIVDVLPLKPAHAEIKWSYDQLVDYFDTDLSTVCPEAKFANNIEELTVIAIDNVTGEFDASCEGGIDMISGSCERWAEDVARGTGHRACIVLCQSQTENQSFRPLHTFPISVPNGPGKVFIDDDDADDDDSDSNAEFDQENVAPDNSKRRSKATTSKSKSSTNKTTKNDKVSKRSGKTGATRSRLTKEQKQEIYEMLMDDPGIDFAELRVELQLPPVGDATLQKIVRESGLSEDRRHARRNFIRVGPSMLI